WMESVEQKKEHEAEGRIWSHKSKEYRHFISHALPIINDAGNIFEWVGMNTDIHEQKLAEIRIRESEERFRLMADSSPMMVWLLDKEGRSYYYNKTLLALLGKNEKNLETDNWDIELHPDDRERIEATIMEGVRTISPYKLEGRIKRYDGEWRWLMAHGNPRFGADNEFLGFIGSSMDITERKQAEELLKESEELFRHFSNNITNLAWMADGEGSIFWYNQRWLDYTGKTLEDMKGWGWQKVHHPDHVDRILEISKKLWPAGKPFELTFPLRHHSGEFRWFLTRAVPIKDKDGKVYKWIGTNTDINERVETAKALTLAKEQLELMFQNVPAAIYLFNDKGELLVVNEKGSRIWGFSNSQEILELKTLGAFKKEIANRYLMFDEQGHQLADLESATDKTLETGQPSEMTVEMVDKTNKKSIWLLSRSSPLFDEGGKVRMVLNISTDITEQKKSEREIRDSEKRFRTLIEAFPQMAWIASPDGKATYYNKSWYDYTGISEEEALTHGGTRAIHADDLPKLHEIWQRHRISGQPLEVELRYRHVNEHKYSWFLVRGRPVMDENGNIAQWIGTCTNIQHLKDISSLLEKQVHERTNELEELNTKLEQQAVELKISNEDLQQFAHVASHDLKEPVRKIKTYSNRLRTEFQNQFPAGAEKFLEKIERSSERLYDLIDGILQYSSIDIEQDTSSSIDLTDLIRQIESDHEMAVQEKNAKIRCENLPTIHGSRVLLYQLFSNLINNALKFSKPDAPPQIQIKSRIVTNLGQRNLPGKYERFAEISVQDNGIGFDQGQAEKIFKTFTRLHSKDHFEGTGLGLALCKKIVERHSGKITAEGQPGVGAIFKIWLPI
ncbi:MAG TPA: PAS domain S-box protein, partial [Chitinophagaceae bacterium]|nr:PAS domain S-box protein [Chitinophagaceae bacterium]